MAEHTSLRRGKPRELAVVGMVYLSGLTVTGGEHRWILTLPVTGRANSHLARPLVESEPEILPIGCYLIRFVERVAVAALLVAHGVKRQISRLIIWLLTVAVLTMPGEFQIRHGLIADVSDRGMTVAAIDLSVPFARRITCLSDSNESDGEECADQKESDFKLGPVPGNTHIWSIGIRAPTFLCESCTVWSIIIENPSVSVG